MGCITSRGENWPPKPYKRLVVRERAKLNRNGMPTGETETVEDYIWVYPGEWLGGGTNVGASWEEEASPAQEAAIRALEESP
jgi:hypothetical protein